MEYPFRSLVRPTITPFGKPMCCVFSLVAVYLVLVSHQLIAQVPILHH